MANVQMNQFGMNAVKGMVDLRSGQPTMSAQIDSTQVGSVTPAQAVKIVSTNPRGIPKVIAADAAADDVFGFAVYDVKSSEFVAGDRLEILPMKNGVMYMEANAAIVQNAEVSIVVASKRVKTAAATERVIGRALDAATAAGQLIRVIVDLPGAIKA